MKLCAALLLLCASVALPMPLAEVQLESAECKACRFMAGLLHNLWGEQTTEDCIGDLFTYICSNLHIEDHFVCKGMVSEFKDEFIYVAGQLIVNPDEICSILIKDCGNAPFNPFEATWHLPVPGNKPAYKPPKLPASGFPTLRVLHISDLHLDMDYVVGAEADCNEPQCCRNAGDTHERTAVKTPAGQWGHIGKCDAPYWLAENMMQHIAATHKDIDYIVVSGDLESHADWDYTHETHQFMIRNISSLIRKYMPSVNTYFAVGNHEGVPIDNFAPRFAPEKFHMDWLYGTMAEAWKSWLPADQLPTVRFNGCYMTKLFPGLRLISLNNALGDAVNFYLYINQTDPDGTMTWFFNQLADAEAAGDKVHVVGHIPGGSSEALEGWAINYYNAINRFENTVTAQFFGHTHSEELRMMYANTDDATSRPTSVVYSAPSLTTFSDYNPAYRVYTIDGNYPRSSFQILDFEEYFFNLTEANAAPSNAQWKTLYSSVIKEYGMKSVQPSEWNAFIERMRTDDGLFWKYMKNYHRHTNFECDYLCKMGQLCSMRSSHNSKTLCEGLVKERKVDGHFKSPSRPIPTHEEIRANIALIKATRKANDKCPV